MYIYYNYIIIIITNGLSGEIDLSATVSKIKTELQSQYIMH